MLNTLLLLFIIIKFLFMCESFTRQYEINKIEDACNFDWRFAMLILL